MKKLIYTPIFILCWLTPILLLAQNKYRSISYNVENFFDCSNNPLKQDDDFTPTGIKHWTNSRYSRKTANIAHVLYKIASVYPTPFIALQEIENEYILKDLLQKTALSRFRYSFIHNDSPDIRGIDVALVYREDLFHPIDIEFIPVGRTSTPSFPTREILFCKGLFIPSNDTIYVYVIHFPSKRGGYAESHPKQEVASTLLLHHIDSTILSIQHNPYIMIMGDFNMNTSESSYQVITHHIQKKKSSPDFQKTGSYKYKGKWQELDHIILSDAFFTDITPSYSTITRLEETLPELFIYDKKYYGNKPFPTYYGYRYLGGFSDHLPIYTDYSL